MSFCVIFMIFFLNRKLRETGRVVEPLKDFHKDEVRAMGVDLGLPKHLVERHPFPGPGLAIRIICADEPYIEKDLSETQVKRKDEIYRFYCSITNFFCDIGYCKVNCRLHLQISKKSCFD